LSLSSGSKNEKIKYFLTIHRRITHGDKVGLLTIIKQGGRQRERQHDFVLYVDYSTSDSKIILKWNWKI
jgi:hypothetical protein